MNFKDRIILKLQEMNRYLRDLEELLPEDKKIYLMNLMQRRACEKTIELAIEAVIDIVAMIVSYEKLGVPESEDDLINFLAKKTILTQRVRNTIPKMKGFRNILVHKYGEIDNGLVYMFLSEKLDDFYEFEKEIKRYLQRN